MITLNRTKHRAFKQMSKAISRGDFDAALRWSLIFDGQLMIAKRVSDLGQRRPRRKPRKPLPKFELPPQEKRPAGKAKPPEDDPENYVLPLEFYYPEHWPNGVPPGPVPKSSLRDGWMQPPYLRSKDGAGP